MSSPHETLAPMNGFVLYGRWGLGALMITLGLYGIVGNWMIFYRNLRGPRFVSWIPLLSAMCAGLGMLVIPIHGLWRWMWVPFILDWGSLPGLSHAAWYWIVVSPRIKKDHSPSSDPECFDNDAE